MLKKLLIFLLFIGTILHATIPTQVTVTKLYVATLDRAPDIEGLNYWVDDSGLSLEQIAISFFDQPETQKKYPKETSHRNFIKSIYANLFNRIPDNEGWDYWEEELESQSIQLSVFILAVTNGALDDDAKIIKNRTTIALTFALSGKSDTTEASKVLEDITDEEESVSKAVENFGLDGTVVSSTQQNQIDSNSPIDIVKTETPNEETTNEDKKQEDIPEGLILKESFENLRANNGWHVERGEVTGDHGIVWDTHNNGLEVERGIVSATIDGDVHAELDAHHNVTISTQVALKSGLNYELSFYIKPRGKNNKSTQKDTSAMEISLGDNVVSIESDKDGQLSTNFDNTNMSVISKSKDSGWTEVTIIYTNIIQDSNTLTIKGTGADDSYGMLLDNIELRGEASDNQEESNTQLSNITDEAISSKVQSVIDELEKIKIELSDVESYDGDKLKQEYDGVKKRFDDVKKLLDDVKKAIDNSSLDKVALKKEADDLKKLMDDLKKVIDGYKQGDDNSVGAIDDIKSRIDGVVGGMSVKEDDTKSEEEILNLVIKTISDGYTFSNQLAVRTITEINYEGVETEREQIVHRSFNIGEWDGQINEETTLLARTFIGNTKGLDESQQNLLAKEIVTTDEFKSAISYQKYYVESPLLFGSIYQDYLALLDRKLVTLIDKYNTNSTSTINTRRMSRAYSLFKDNETLENIGGSIKLEYDEGLNQFNFSNYHSIYFGLRSRKKDDELGYSFWDTMENNIIDPVSGGLAGWGVSELMDLFNLDDFDSPARTPMKGMGFDNDLFETETQVKVNQNKLYEIYKYQRLDDLSTLYNMFHFIGLLAQKDYTEKIDKNKEKVLKSFKVVDNVLEVLEDVVSIASMLTIIADYSTIISKENSYSVENNLDNVLKGINAIQSAISTMPLYSKDDLKKPIIDIKKFKLIFTKFRDIPESLKSTFNTLTKKEQSNIYIIANFSRLFWSEEIKVTKSGTINTTNIELLHYQIAMKLTITSYKLDTEVMKQYFDMMRKKDFNIFSKNFYNKNTESIFKNLSNLSDMKDLFVNTSRNIGNFNDKILSESSVKIFFQLLRDMDIINIEMDTLIGKFKGKFGKHPAIRLALALNDVGSFTFGSLILPNKMHFKVETNEEGEIKLKHPSFSILGILSDLNEDGLRLSNKVYAKENSSNFLVVTDSLYRPIYNVHFMAKDESSIFEDDNNFPNQTFVTMNFNIRKSTTDSKYNFTDTLDNEKNINYNIAIKPSTIADGGIAKFNMVDSADYGYYFDLYDAWREQEGLKDKNVRVYNKTRGIYKEWIDAKFNYPKDTDIGESIDTISDIRYVYKIARADEIKSNIVLSFIKEEDKVVIENNNDFTICLEPYYELDQEGRYIDFYPIDEKVFLQNKCVERSTSLLLNISDFKDPVSNEYNDVKFNFYDVIASKYFDEEGINQPKYNNWKKQSGTTLNEMIYEVDLDDIDKIDNIFDVEILSMDEVSPKENGIASETEFIFKVNLSKELPTAEYGVYLNFDDSNGNWFADDGETAGGHKALDCVGTVCTFKDSITSAGNRKVRAGIFKGDILQENYFSERYFNVLEAETVTSNFESFDCETNRDPKTSSVELLTCEKSPSETLNCNLLDANNDLFECSTVSDSSGKKFKCTYQNSSLLSCVEVSTELIDSSDTNHFFMVTQGFSVNAYQPASQSNVNVYSYSQTDQDQYWVIENTNNIRRYNTDLCLNAHNPAQGSNVNLYGCDKDNAEQQWEAICDSTESCLIRLQNTSYCLNAHSPSNSSNLNIYNCKFSDPEQQFKRSLIEGNLPIYEVNEPITPTIDTSYSLFDCTTNRSPLTSSSEALTCSTPFETLNCNILNINNYSFQCTNGNGYQTSISDQNYQCTYKDDNTLSCSTEELSISSSTMNKFVDATLNQCIDMDDSDGCQCMDLMHYYVEEILSIPRSVSLLVSSGPNYIYYTLFANKSSITLSSGSRQVRLDKIPNTATSIPQVGDIIIWKADSSNGGYGHVGIFISGDVNKFKSFDQNWYNFSLDNGSKAAVIDHTYNLVAGYLRPVILSQ